MWFDEFKKYAGLFVLGVALIAVYKTFDNFGILLDGLKYIFSLLTPFFIGGITAYILYIPCKKLEALYRKTGIQFIDKHRRSLSVASIYIIFIAFIALILVAIIPSLIKSITEFTDQLPELVDGAISWFNSLGIYKLDGNAIENLFSRNLISIDKIIGGISFDSMNKYAKGVMSFGTAIFNAFIGIIISIYLLLDRASLRRTVIIFARRHMSKKYRRLLGRYCSKINSFVELYIYCLFIDAVIVFILSFLALSIMRVKYASLLALMLGSFNLIPYFGAITATVLSALITVFTKSFASGVAVAVVLTILQQVDANVIQPRLLSDSLNIKPVWVIFAIILGGGLFGVIGIIFAVPSFALIKIICTDIAELTENRYKHSRHKNKIDADAENKL